MVNGYGFTDLRSLRGLDHGHKNHSYLGDKDMGVSVLANDVLVHVVGQVRSGTKVLMSR